MELALLKKEIFMTLCLISGRADLGHVCCIGQGNINCVDLGNVLVCWSGAILSVLPKGDV